MKEDDSTPPARSRRRGLPTAAPADHATSQTAAQSSPSSEKAEKETAAQRPARRRTGMGAGTGTGTGPAAEGPAAQKPARRAGMASAQAPEKAETASAPAPSAGPDPAPVVSGTGVGAGASEPDVAEDDTAEAAPRRISRWGALILGGAAGVVVLAGVLVVAARWLLGTEPVSGFVEDYPGQYPQPNAPGGYPWWLNWAHFFNMFLMVLVIKTGIQIRRETRPEAYWTPRWNPKRRISLTIWVHQALDLLWVLNGVIFVVLLVATGYWTRVVPTSWEVLPNAVSAGLQYASLDWPTTGDWAHYNSLQELAYFTTIFIAAPLAVTTGIRMSGLWPAGHQALDKAFPVELARAVHFPVMIYFTAFITVHVILVFATGALSNLNQIYTGQETTNWTGFWLFALSLAVIIGAAAATRAVIVAPIASLFGKVGR